MGLGSGVRTKGTQSGSSTDNEAKNKSQPSSLDNRGVPNYNSISGSPIVFCSHGNKFGMATCCNDLTEEIVTADQEKKGRQELDEKLPLLVGSISLRSSLSSLNGDLHCHPDQDGNGNGIDKKARRKLIIASVLCLVFMIIEIVGGVLANSLAIATDAAHLLTDLASFCISLFSIWVASRPATQRMSFGWHRAEVIGATVSVLLIWVVTGILVYAAALRIINKDFEIDGVVMLVTSGIGIGVNIIMGCSLHQHGHGHGGGSASQQSLGESESGHGHQHNHENINVKAAFIHVIGDFVQSLGVFVAALIIYFKPEWNIVDPICTFIFSVLVLLTTLRILRDTMNVLMEGIPREVSFSVVQETFLSVDGIRAVHNLRIWGLTTDKTALSAHLAIDHDVSPKEILKTASRKIRSKYNIYEMTLQVEEYNTLMDDCGQCQGPKS